MSGLEVLGAVAGGAQLIQLLLGIVHEIIRAADDFKVVAGITQGLLNQVIFVGRVLERIREEQKYIPEYLKPELENLKETLDEVKAEVNKCVAKNKEGEGKFLSEVGKNLLHQGGTKRMKKLEEMSNNLKARCLMLCTALTVETRDLVIETHGAVIKTHGAVIETHGAVIKTHGAVIETHEAVDEIHDQVSEIPKVMEKYNVEQSEHNMKVTIMLDQIGLEAKSINMKLDRGHEVQIADPANQFPEKIENQVVLQLIEAAYVDSDNDSCSVQLESQCDPRELWQVLYDDFAGGDPGAEEEQEQEKEEKEERRASVSGGYAVKDESSLRFTMSVNQKRFFLFLTYAHVSGAELKVYYPTRADMKHEITKQDSRVLFPDRQNKSFRRGPPRFEVRKQGSSRKSKESIFLVFSRNSLVRADSQSCKKNLDFTDVAEELQKHLEKKLGEEGCDYREIIVKHLMVDIFAT